MSPSDRPPSSSQPAGENRSQRSSKEQEAQIPPQILQQADDAAAAATSDGYDERPPYSEQSVFEAEPSIEELPPPPYSAGQYGEIEINEKGMGTGARVAGDGRVNINISSKNRQLASLLRQSMIVEQDVPTEPEIPEGLGYVSGLPPPSMNVVIQIVGSRGDVQPFIALGLVLKEKFNHRVRIATHPVFKDFVTENGLEFFSIGGDPAELMAFMVKNPGLMPGIEAIRSGDIGRRRRGIYEMIQGCWRSCIEPGDGTGAPATDESVEGRSIDSGISIGDPNAKPFVADAIIANPPSFAHIHIAEKLGVPLHLMFTMPWSPTQSFPHPLANVVSSNADAGMTNFLSYILVDLLTWQGIGDVINRFREKTLRLEPLSIIWAPGNLHRLRIPWTYCWSPALIPKPNDWPLSIDISGFYFLNLATNYTPPPDLEEFLNAGPPPVYIGFGSIVVDDPNALTKMLFEAVKKTGQRALISKGWGGLSGDEMGVPEGVFMLGNCPHDWLFQKVSCVVHHGGAGTTAAGISAGRPTIIVPFFGDQQFWGQMCHRAGAGPEPIPHKKLTADNLAEAINFAIQPEVLERAKEMSNKIKQESGTDTGAESFHRHLNISKLRCSICPGRVAVWQYKRGKIRLSALAATVLANEGLLEFSDLRLYRSREYTPETGPPEPITGGGAALIGTLASVTSGVADYPAEILKAFKKSSSNKQRNDSGASPGTSTASIRPLLTPSSSATRSSPPTESPNQSTTASTTGSLRGVFSDSSGPTTPTESTASVGGFPGASSSANIIVSDADKEALPGWLSRHSSDADSRRRSANGSLRPDMDHRRVLSSRGSSRPGSGSTTPKGHERSRSISSNAGQITMDSLVGSARATSNIVVAGMKSPLDFTMGIAQGFHNAPKLYGDKTVRPQERVTGFQSGLKAAGKEFGFGFYDGIAGLVTQPYQGAKEEGVVGFGKGLIRGSLGVVLKPGAAIWGLPGYTMKGVYAELVKNFGKSTQNFIIAARTAQGYDDWKSSSEGERERIVVTWKSDIMQARATTKLFGAKKELDKNNDRRFYGDDGELLKGFRATKHLSWEDRKELERLRKESKMTPDEKAKRNSKSRESVPRVSSPIQTPTGATGSGSFSATTDDEFEQAIRTAVQRTSNNDPEEDARVERAIRASVREFQRKMSQRAGQTGGDNDDDNEAYNRAVAVSATEYQRVAPNRSVLESGVDPSDLDNRDDDEEFSRALAASLEESQRAQSQRAARTTHDSDIEDDDEFLQALEASKNVQPSADDQESDDEEYRRAIEESKRVNVRGTNRYQHQSQPYGSSSRSAAPIPTESPPGYEVAAAELSGDPPSHYGTPTNFPSTARDSVNRVGATDSKAALRDSVSAVPNDADDEDEFQRTLRASEEEAKQRETDLRKQKAEEDIVLEYIKKQSLAEEEYRRKRAGGSS